MFVKIQIRSAMDGHPTCGLAIIAFLTAEPEILFTLPEGIAANTFIRQSLTMAEREAKQRERSLRNKGRLEMDLPFAENDDADREDGPLALFSYYLNCGIATEENVKDLIANFLNPNSKKVELLNPSEWEFDDGIEDPLICARQDYTNMEQFVEGRTEVAAENPIFKRFQACAKAILGLNYHDTNSLMFVDQPNVFSTEELNNGATTVFTLK